MTDETLATIAAAVAKVQVSWERRIAKVIRDKVNLAHAHALRALTERLRRTPQGRPSVRHASQSPSYVAAGSDLDSLLTNLAGPMVNSTNGGLIRSGYEALYIAAFKAWLPVLGEHGLGVDAAPLASRSGDVRGLVLHGYELRTEIGGAVNKANSSLLAALERASQPGVLNQDGIDKIADWRITTRSSLTLVAVTVLGDAGVALTGWASVDALKPEYRPKDGFAPE